jgi:hypothetical protein
VELDARVRQRKHRHYSESNPWMERFLDVRNRSISSDQRVPSRRKQPEDHARQRRVNPRYGCGSYAPVKAVA